MQYSSKKMKNYKNEDHTKSVHQSYRKQKIHPRGVPENERFSDTGNIFIREGKAQQMSIICLERKETL